MTFPLEFYENFEGGAKGNFDSETDTGNRLDFPHARDLAPYAGPFRGAYCLRADLGKNSSDAYLEEAVSWVAEATRYGRFRIFIGPDVEFGNNLDNVRVLQLVSGTNVKEAYLALARIDPLGLCLVAAADEETLSSISSHFALPFGQWVTIEWRVTNPVSANMGTIQAFLPGVGAVTSVANTIDDVTKMRLGVMSQTGDLRGTILFDEFAIDENRLYDDESSARNGALSGRTMHLAKTGFAFLGPGFIEHASLIDGGSGDCALQIYDIEEAPFTPAGALRESLATTVADTTAQSLHAGFRVQRGAYVQLSGTNPQALIRLGRVASDPQ